MLFLQNMQKSSTLSFLQLGLHRKYTSTSMRGFISDIILIVLTSKHPFGLSERSITEFV